MAPTLGYTPPMARSDIRASFEELDVRQTPLGELVLRRRRPVSMPDTWVYEVTLERRFLMSNLVRESEEALAHLALARLTGEHWRVLVGGLGLGQTAAAALGWDQVDELQVVEYLPEVIAWHRRGLVPLGDSLTASERCEIVQADAFDVVRASPPESWDAVLIDIDDSPEHLLDPAHSVFYTGEGLEDARRALRPGGVLAIWTAGERLPGFHERLASVFPSVDVEVVRFENPLLMRDDENTIYIARR